MTLILRSHRDSINIACICGWVISLSQVREALLENETLDVNTEVCWCHFLSKLLKKNTLGAVCKHKPQIKFFYWLHWHNLAAQIISGLADCRVLGEVYCVWELPVYQKMGCFKTLPIRFTSYLPLFLKSSLTFIQGALCLWQGQVLLIQAFFQV